MISQYFKVCHRCVPARCPRFDTAGSLHLHSLDNPGAKTLSEIIKYKSVAPGDNTNKHFTVFDQLGQYFFLVIQRSHDIVLLTEMSLSQQYKHHRFTGYCF